MSKHLYKNIQTTEDILKAQELPVYLEDSFIIVYIGKVSSVFDFVSRVFKFQEITQVKMKEFIIKSYTFKLNEVY